VSAVTSPRSPLYERPQLARRLGLGAFGVLLLVALAMTGPQPASAHAELLNTSPANGASLTAAPSEVVLTFNEAPLALGALVHVTGPTGQVSQGAPQIKGHEVHQSLNPSLAAGQYNVAWKVASDDGHPVSGKFAFTLTAASSATSQAPTTSVTPTATTAIQAGTMPATQLTGSATSTTWWPWIVIVLVLLVALVAILLIRLKQTRENP
jgi:methionine-rich copper-binding protein CopC